MLLSDISLTREDFDQYNWQEVITQCQKKDCSYYESRFIKKANEASESGDVKAQGVFTLLAAISSFELGLESKEKPFGPQSIFDGIRTAIPDDITHEQLALLKELLKDIPDAELRARIADVLWDRKCGHKMAECAVKSYLESSKMLEETGHFVPISQRLERALQLAFYLNDDLLTDVVVYIESFLERCDNDRNQIQTLATMKVVRRNRKKLKRYGKLNSSDYAALAEREAARAEKKERWILAEQYWSIAASWYATQNNAEKESDARKRAAETYVRQSEDALNKRNPPSYPAAYHFHRLAILAYRRIPGTEELVEELHKQLLEYGEKSRAEVHNISLEIDEEIQESMKRDMERAKERVKGKTIQEALFTLARLASSPNVPALRKAAQDAMKEHPELFLFPREVFTNSGKVAHRSSGGTDNTQEEATLRDEMFTQAQLQRYLNIKCKIEPARR